MEGDTEKLESALEKFIRDRFHVRPDDARFSRVISLWDEGYVDSAGVVEVVAFLEAWLGERVPDELLFEPDFTTIRGMAARVSALTST